MTINLEHTHDDNETINRNFDTLRQIAVDTGGLSIGIRFGVGAIVWPGGSAFTNVTVITHGLGTTPKIVLLTSATSNAVVAYSTITATTFSVTGQTADGALPALNTTYDFTWCVVG